MPTIDHPKGGHDDCANATALGVAELAKHLHPAIGGTLESLTAEPEERASLEAKPHGGFHGRESLTLAAAVERRMGAHRDALDNDGGPQRPSRFWR